MSFTPPAQLTIRDAVEADLPQIVAIFNAAVPSHTANAELEPVSVASRQAWFLSHSPERRPLWVTEEAGQILAWVGLRDLFTRPAYSITAEVSLYVAPEQQNRGLGPWLLKQLLAECPRFGIENVVAIVFAHNERSVRMHQKLGFVEWGRLPQVASFYGVRRDVLMLGKAVGG